MVAHGDLRVRHSGSAMMVAVCIVRIALGTVAIDAVVGRYGSHEMQHTAAICVQTNPQTRGSTGVMLMVVLGFGQEP